MGSAILAWLAHEGAGLLLGALAKMAVDFFNSYRSDQALKQAGRAEVANEVNIQTVETKDEMDSVARPSDDAVRDSLRTGTF